VSFLSLTAATIVAAAVTFGDAALGAVIGGLFLVVNTVVNIVTAAWVRRLEHSSTKAAHAASEGNMALLELSRNRDKSDIRDTDGTDGTGS
jgi:hypothetical protein